MKNSHGNRKPYERERAGAEMSSRRQESAGAVLLAIFRGNLENLPSIF
jgi:hypothetical protein